MSATPTQTLFKAYEHIQAGRLREARSMLKKLLRSHPNTERGWLLMSMAVADPNRQRECLRRVLQLNPFNTEAQHRLAALPAATSDTPVEVMAQTEPLVSPEKAPAAEAHASPLIEVEGLGDVPTSEWVASIAAPSEAERSPVEESAAPAEALAAEPAPIAIAPADSSPPTSIEELAPIFTEAMAEAFVPEIGAAPFEAASAPMDVVSEPEVEPLPTRTRGTGLLTPLPTVTSGSSPAPGFEPERPRATEPLSNTGAALEVGTEAPTSEKVHEPKPETTEKLRSHRRALQARKLARAQRHFADHRERAAEPEATPDEVRPTEATGSAPTVVEMPSVAPPVQPPPPESAPAPPVSRLAPVVGWQRMYERANLPSESAQPAVLPEAPRPPAPPAPVPQWDLPPAPPRNYADYEGEGWPRVTLPLALIVWFVAVLVVFFVIARLLMG